MMRQTSLAAVVVLALAASASAATIQLGFILNPVVPACASCTLSGPNTWALTATDITSDNFGISAFSIPVTGVLTNFNRSPRTVVNPNDTADPAGFTSVRSGTNGVVIPGGFLIGGGQDNITPTPYLIRGFGQEASSFVLKAPPLSEFGAPSTQIAWSNPLVLAEGTNAPGVKPVIDFSSVDIGVNVFSSANGIGTVAARVIPEPACIVLAGLGTLGLIGLVRRRA